MVAPKHTIWKLDPHTAAKHAVLRRYLQAWTPILIAGGFRKIAYVDGFAGPGAYEGGEDGSPIIALKAALEHSPRVSAEIHFLFIEEKKDRSEHLGRLVFALALPKNFVVKIEGEQTFENAFNRFRARVGRFPPTFAFIDPFGWTGAPFSSVSFILSQQSCEVLITFMYEEINRFIELPEQEANFDTLFGCPDWREIKKFTRPIDRSRCLHDVYARQLKTGARAKYVRSFCMRNKSGATDYFLFYAINSQLGLKKMKEAMWKVDSSGEFTFSDATDQNQFVLFGGEPRIELLRDQILHKFDGREVTIGDVEEFVLAETAFRDAHYRQILKALEYAMPTRLEIVDPPPKRRRGTYPSPNQKIRFIKR